MVDREFATAEKQQLKTTLNQLIPASGNLRSFTQFLITGIRKQKTYKKSQAWKVLNASLAQPEKLLLIGLGFKMSAADGQMDVGEQKYLQKIAQLFGISPQHIECFINFFSNGDCKENVLKEIKIYLEPSQLLHLSPVCAQAASNLLLSLNFPQQINNINNKIKNSYQQLDNY